MTRTKAKLPSTTKPKPAPVIKKEPRKYLSASEQAPDVPRAVFTIAEFCSANRLSLPMYYKMKKAKQGPRESYAGAKVLITLANAAAWLKALDDQPTKFQPVE